MCLIQSTLLVYMKHVRRILRNPTILFLIFLSAALRFYKLGVVPEGFTPDELGYIYNAYSISQTGRNFYGELLPLYTFFGVHFLPTTTYFLVPVMWLFGPDPFFARSLHALLGVIEVLLVYFITLHLFKSRRLALFTGIFLSISPWHLQFTRSAYDNVIALFLYLSAVLVFLTAIRKRFSILWSLPLFFLAIYSFRAMSVIFIPIALLLLWYSWDSIRSNKKTLLLYLAGLIVIATSFVYTSSTLGPTYTQEAFRTANSPFNTAVAQQEVDTELKQSEAPLSVSRLFSNKPLYTLRKIRENYLGFFSTQFLFTHGDGLLIYSLWWRGMLYLIKLPLIFLGIFYLLKKNKKAAWFVFISILIAPLPSALAGPPYASRGFYAVPFFMILSSAGIFYTYELLKKVRQQAMRNTLAITLIGIFVFQIASYLFQYHYRYSTYGAEAWFKSEKDLAFYIESELPHYEAVIVGRTAIYDFIEYAFWSKSDPRDIQAALKTYDPESLDPIFLGNIMFIQECLIGSESELSRYLERKTLYITRDECHNDRPLSPEIPVVASIHEKGSIRRIWKAYEINPKTIDLFRNDLPITPTSAP